MTVLDPDTHGRLIAEIDEIAREAGVPKKYIEQSMTNWCGDDEIGWVKDYRENPSKGVYGMVYLGNDHTQKMMAVCGAFTRNFILAKLVTMHDLLDRLREGSDVTASVLVIPSFYKSLDKGGLTPYQIGLLWDLLEDRMINEKQTVLGVDSLSKLKSGYGEHFSSLIESHYFKVAC